MTMCDFCGKPADHDKPYQMGREDLLGLRVEPDQIAALWLMRQDACRTRDGRPTGAAAGDLVAAPVEPEPAPAPAPEPEPESPGS